MLASMLGEDVAPQSNAPSRKLEEGAPVERQSAYDIRQAEKARRKERAGPEMQDFVGRMDESLKEGGNWVVENPIDAASAAALAYSGLGLVPAGVRIGAAGLRALGPKVLRGARSLYSKQNPAFWSKVNPKTGTRSYPAGVPERLFSPGRTATTATGVQGLEYLWDQMFGGEEETPESSAAAESSDMQKDVASQYAELMRNLTPPDAAAEYAKTFFGETPQAAETTPSANQRVNAESTLAPDAGISRLTSPTAEAAAIQAFDTRAAAPPLQTAATQTAAPQDAGISRYEQQYDNLLTQQEDKLDKLITFLLSAGASGGTNLGATLTGGGVGLQNRDARIKAEIDDTIKNIEALKLDREKMQMDQSRFESDLTLRRDVAEANKSQAQAQLAQQKELAEMDIESAEDLAVLNNAAEQTIRASASQDTVTRGQNDNNRAIFNAAAKSQISLRKQLSEGNLAPDEKAKLELELARTNENLIKLQTQLERFSGDNIDYDSLED